MLIQSDEKCAICCEDRTVITIGGGSLADKTTHAIDEYAADLAKKRAGDRRAVGVFIGTASHDFMPYFNTFRKTYTSDFKLKADCVLTVYGEMDEEKIKSKFAKADLIYIGGGDTVYMLDFWKERGIYDLVLDAYRRGVIIVGLSAGAICWFEEMYTDSEKLGTGDKYNVQNGIGEISGICCPHYNHRVDDFDKAFESARSSYGWCIEDDAAVVFENGRAKQILSTGGKVYFVNKTESGIIKTRKENMLND